MLKVEEQNGFFKLSETQEGDFNGNEDLKNSYSSKNSNTMKIGDLNVPPTFLKDSVTLESDTEALAHQIAGHTRTGILKHKLGYVLKPLQKEPLGSREVEFYKTVFGLCAGTGEPPLLLNHQSVLQTLIPKFHGMTKIKSSDGIGEGPVWKEYLALDDIIEGFTYPCVTDIKIGAVTWDPNATPKKIEHEKSKYKGTKAPLGLSLSGMQYFDLNVHTQIKMEKDLGKTIDERGLVGTVEKFLNRAYHEQIPGIVAKKVVQRLNDFQEYFAVQRDFRFYSSSLLIAYDAEKFANYGNSTTRDCGILGQDEDDVSSWLRVWMIDFAHVFPADGDKEDVNYLFGLGNLVKIFQGIGSKC